MAAEAALECGAQWPSVSTRSTGMSTSAQCPEFCLYAGNAKSSASVFPGSHAGRTLSTNAAASATGSATRRLLLPRVGVTGGGVGVSVGVVAKNLSLCDLRPKPIPLFLCWNCHRDGGLGCCLLYTSPSPRD